MKPWASVLFVLLVHWCAVTPCKACSMAIQYLSVDARWAENDSLPPARPSLKVDRIKRGRGPIWLRNSSFVATSCDDIGLIRVLARSLPGEPVSALGIEFRVVDGLLPAGFTVPPQPLLLSPADSASAVDGFPRQQALHWLDGAKDDQEPFAFRMVAVAVDAAGNRSVPSDTLQVAHAGR